MVPERLNYLTRLNEFIGVITEQAKQNKLSERDFYLIIRAKCKAMDQERREKLSKITTVKVIGAKKKDLKH